MKQFNLGLSDTGLHFGLQLWKHHPTQENKNKLCFQYYIKLIDDTSNISVFICYKCTEGHGLRSQFVHVRIIHACACKACVDNPRGFGWSWETGQDNTIPCVVLICVSPPSSYLGCVNLMLNIALLPRDLAKSTNLIWLISPMTYRHRCKAVSVNTRNGLPYLL